MKNHYHYRKIKYWNVVADNLDIKTAVRMLKAQAVHGRQYEYLAIRLKYKIFEPGTNMDKIELPIEEVLSDKWEAIIPDDGAEETLEKAREMVKDANFLRYNHEQINNMNIEDIWNAIDDVITCLDDKVKYRLIKHIIENKLYKKT